MHTPCTQVSRDHMEQTINFPFKKGFTLSDMALIASYQEQYAPMSCEYNFANLFAWNEAYTHLWCSYEDRILIYDTAHNQAFMPMGEDLTPEALAGLAQYLIRAGLCPVIGLVCRDYLEYYPEVEKFFLVEENRDHAEYLYLTRKLHSLRGTKLHKKKNLIAQFNSLYPDYRIKTLGPGDLEEIEHFSRQMLDRMDSPDENLENEYRAIVKTMTYFNELNMGGLSLSAEDRMIAFSLFSRLNPFTYDIQFEKSDYEYKGASQVINWETAKFLKGKCRYLNREQDLGIKGLRQAKLSYDPEALFIPYVLKFKQ